MREKRFHFLSPSYLLPKTNEEFLGQQLSALNKLEYQLGKCSEVRTGPTTLKPGFVDSLAKAICELMLYLNQENMGLYREIGLTAFPEICSNTISDTAEHVKFAANCHN